MADSLRNKRYRAENKEAIRARHLIRMAFDPDYAARLRNNSRKYNTGWTAEEFEHAWEKQKGCCAICKKELEKGTRSKTSVCADHCHTTRKPRGLLCVTCNTMLGSAHDDPAILRAGMRYLKKHG